MPFEGPEGNANSSNPHRVHAAVLLHRPLTPSEPPLAQGGNVIREPRISSCGKIGYPLPYTPG
jgi:hypothetical protein